MNYQQHSIHSTYGNINSGVIFNWGNINKKNSLIQRKYTIIISLLIQNCYLIQSIWMIALCNNWQFKYPRKKNILRRAILIYANRTSSRSPGVGVAQSSKTIISRTAGKVLVACSVFSFRHHALLTVHVLVILYEDNVRGFFLYLDELLWSLRDVDVFMQLLFLLQSIILLSSRR